MAVVLKKQGNFEFLYLKNVPVYFACVHTPKDKYQVNPDAKNKSKREYAITVFVDDADREKLEDEVMINKTLMEVAVGKTKKRKIKYPLEKQLSKEDKEAGKTAYDDVKGLHGMQLTLNEFTNAGKPAQLVVVDKNGEPFSEDIGNGSVCNIKCFGYRNKDDLLVVSLNIVQVVEHVPYEGGTSGKVVDDELGISLTLPEQKAKESISEEFGDDDNIPFDTEDEDDPF